MQTLRRSNRYFHSRGIPYTPIGTFQDYSYSQRFADLPHLQREKDLKEGREPTKLYEGPTVVTKEGVRSVHNTNSESYFEQEKESKIASRQKKVEEQKDEVNCNTRKHPHDDYVERLINNNAAFEQIVGSVTSGGFGYTRDPRVDPQYDNIPPHIRAARYSIMCMQADSAGECIRGVVPPPPCSLKSQLQNNEINDCELKCHQSATSLKSTKLTLVWYRCLIAVITLFSLLLYFGH